MSIVSVVKCQKELARLRAAMAALEEKIPKLEAEIGDYLHHLYSNTQAMAPDSDVTDLSNGRFRGTAQHYRVHGNGQQPELEAAVTLIHANADALEGLRPSIEWLLRLFYWEPIDATRCAFCQMIGGHALDCFRDRCRTD